MELDITTQQCNGLVSSTFRTCTVWSGFVLRGDLVKQTWRRFILIFSFGRPLNIHKILKLLIGWNFLPDILPAYKERCTTLYQGATLAKSTLCQQMTKVKDNQSERVPSDYSELFVTLVTQVSRSLEGSRTCCSSVAALLQLCRISVEAVALDLRKLSQCRRLVGATFSSVASRLSCCIIYSRN